MSSPIPAPIFPRSFRGFPRTFRGFPCPDPTLLALYTSCISSEEHPTSLIYFPVHSDMFPHNLIHVPAHSGYFPAHSDSTTFLLSWNNVSPIHICIRTFPCLILHYQTSFQSSWPCNIIPLPLSVHVPDTRSALSCFRELLLYIVPLQYISSA